MNNQNPLKSIVLTSAALLLSSGALTPARSAPGLLAETPLYLTNYSQPNIFYMLDDSGSMDWEIMVQGNGGRFRTNQPDGRNVADAGPIQQRVTAHSGSGNCTEGGYSGTYVYGVEFGSNTYTDDSRDCRTADDQAWRFRNSDFNPLYFDPAKDYTPWHGTNTYDQPYQDVSIANAPDNPYLFNFNSPPGSSETINLILHTSDWEGGNAHDASIGNGFFFYTWNDTDNDGNFDNGEETPYRIGTVTQAEIDAAGWTIPDGSRNKTVAELRQDFANWFSYYRKREYVAKRSISQLIDEGSSRVGLSTIHNHNNVGIPVKDIDNISVPIDTTADANKTALLEHLAQINSSSATPLRRGLRNVGNYFDTATNSNVRDLFGGTTHPSPILPADEGGSCQQNFAILMSDGFWNGGSPSVGNTDTDGSGPWDGASYADSRSHTLADVAMHYYETDLATSLSNDVPVTPGVDENDAQHLVTFTVAFGVDGTLTADPINVNDPFSWPNPISNSGAERIDDMRHAAWNGRGQFLSARNTDELTAVLGAAIKDIDSRSGSAAALSFNSASLQTNTKVFQAIFDSGNWYGDVMAFDLNTLISGGSGALLWQAANELDGRNLASQPRAIITYDGFSGIPFNWPTDYTTPDAGELTSAQIEDLLYSAPYPLTTTDAGEKAANQTFGSRILDYLRGHDDYEGGAPGDLRPRYGHRLADIIHSAPAFVGAPSAPYPDDIEGVSHLYSAFAQGSAKTRDGRIYVGDNGGMLHAFNSETGEEVFAYIPNLVYSNQDGEGLHQLAKRGYEHDYYVDLTATAADVYLNGAWKTLLVGGLRGGGKGIFVMDITTPSALTEANAANVVLDEFTHADLGYTFSEIQVGRMNNGKWAAVFGNGFNNTGSGRAKLFIYYFDGTTPDIIDTQVGSIANVSCADPASDCNGLSTPELVDLNGDGNMDRAYAGDLKGNLWAFDLALEDTNSDGVGDNWNPRPAYETAGVPQPLFIACTADTTSCSDLNRQPITAKPTVARHKEHRAIATAPNLMVFFGTGQFLTTGDKTTTDLQRFYGVWDGGTPNWEPKDLTAQTISTANHATGTVRTISDNVVDYATKKGWRIDLIDDDLIDGERVVVSPIALGDIVFFNTIIPSSSICSHGGSGWLMSVDQLTGGEPGFPVVDLDGDGVIDDLVNSHVPVGVSTDGIATDSRFLPTGNKALRLTTDSSGRIIVELVRAQPEDPAKRMSWTGLQ